MRIAIVAPQRPGEVSGNDVTARRWQRRLTELGHDVAVVELASEEGEGFEPDRPDVAPDAELMVVLHARRCSAAVAGSRRSNPARPVIVGLAGTDLYADLPADPDARAAVDAADALVVLQSLAVRHLAGFDPGLATKAHVVHQSVEPPRPERRPPTGSFDVIVLAHLRDVKDPLLAAQAARLLPEESRVRIIHAGSAHDETWARAARSEEAANPRYQWLGGLERSVALERLAQASVLACTSRLEGGANVVTEALALGVPVIGTAIDGNHGLLGTDHPGLVPVGDASALAELLYDLETNPDHLAELQRRTDERRDLTDPAHERDQWELVLRSLDVV